MGESFTIMVVATSDKQSHHGDRAVVRGNGRCTTASRWSTLQNGDKFEHFHALASTAPAYSTGRTCLSVCLSGTLTYCG